MDDEADEPRLEPHPLAATLRAVRNHRRLRQEEVAEALAMSRRTYVALEAGVGRMSLDQLEKFSNATTSDHYANHAAVMFNKPQLAVRYADNKLMTVLVNAADDFHNAAGERAADVRTQEIIRAVKDAFKTLAVELSDREANDARLNRRLAQMGAVDEPPVAVGDRSPAPSAIAQGVAPEPDPITETEDHR